MRTPVSDDPVRPCAFANKARGRFNFSWWRLPRPLRSLNVVGTLQAVEVWRGVSGSLITGRSQRRNRVLLITAELAYLFAVTETKGWAMRSLIPACIVVVGRVGARADVAARIEDLVAQRNSSIILMRRRCLRIRCPKWERPKPPPKFHSDDGRQEPPSTG